MKPAPYKTHRPALSGIPNWLIAMAILTALSIIGPMDYQDAQQLERSKEDAIAAAKVSAHERARELRIAGLLDDANRMIYPLQASK